MADLMLAQILSKIADLLEVDPDLNPNTALELAVFNSDIVPHDQLDDDAVLKLSMLADDMLTIEHANQHGLDDPLDLMNLARGEAIVAARTAAGRA